MKMIFKDRSRSIKIWNRRKCDYTGHQDLYAKCNDFDMQIIFKGQIKINKNLESQKM